MLTADRSITSLPTGNESPQVLDTTPVMIATGIGRDFGTRVAVQSLSLRLNPGSIVGLLGPNGAGKTTTLSMLAGLLPPTRGAICVHGEDLYKGGPSARMDLGYVPQDLALYGELTARQNLAFFASLFSIPRTHVASRIETALQFAGLQSRAGDRVAQFSGGMQRRLNLAVALLHAPKVLLLDEPTVGVDAQSRAHIFDCIRELRDKERMAIVLTSHYMEEVHALCDEIHIIDDGRIVASGTIESLLKTHTGPVESRGRALEAVFLELTGKALRDNG
jgi:ABC-2 type transport system ATP-binding protein